MEVDSEDAGVYKTYTLVGVGASAGGLSSLERFFAAMPVDSGLAFVVVQHLSPDFKSMMDELLARQTSIPIHQGATGQKVEPNNIYLLPPRQDVRVRNGYLLLDERPAEQKLSLPIDSFLESLAKDAGFKSVAVILSGTGSDGSRGAVAIDRAGGRVFVESSGSASFGGMPKSTVDTGVKAEVMPAEDMAHALLETSAEFESRKESERQTEELRLESRDSLSKVFDFLLAEFNIDFSDYKLSTIARRIARRRAMLHIESLEEYVEVLGVDAAELRNLYEDLLIGVTEFFRDGGAFDALAKDAVPALVEHNGRAGLRAWCAACSTGEEAYSVAITILEEFRRREMSPNLKLFATDVHQGALDLASRGFYDDSRVEALPSDILARYFEKAAGGYRVSPKLRKSVVFAKHDVVRDAPFTDLDLVVCRNFLIYVKKDVQIDALDMFYYGLRPSGILFMGASESPGELAKKFVTIDEHNKIYKKRRDERLSRQLTLKPRLRDRMARPLRMDFQGEPSSSSGVASAMGDVQVSQDPNNRRTRVSFLKRLTGIAKDSLTDAITVAVNSRSFDDKRTRAELHGDLRTARQDLQSTVEELETSNEELQAANEELVASNEELQSTNEELQSVNEELYSVNTEHQTKIVELAELNREVEHLLNASGTATVFLDGELLIRKYTPEMGELLGLVPHDEGRRVEPFLSSMHIDGLFADIKGALRSGKVVEKELPERSGVSYLLRVAPFSGPSVGEGVVVSLIDISVINHMRERVSELSNIVQSSRDAIISTDVQGVITSWNQGAVDLYGYEADEVIGGRLDKLFPVADGDQSTDDVANDSGYIELERVTKGGDKCFVSLRESPVRGDAGDSLGTAEISRDITDRRIAVDRLHREIRLREQFLAMLSHELRNPLGAVRMASEFLSAENVDPTLDKKYREVVVRQTAHMSRLLDDLLDVSRVTQNRLRLDRKVFDLRDSVAGVIETVERIAEDRNTHIKLLVPERPIFVHADPQRMQQIQENLLSNAVKYGPDGQNVTLELTTSDGDAVIRVTDEGFGLEPDDLSQIFDMFVQKCSTLDRSHGGMGVGLTLVSRLVKMHEGTVVATSDGKDRGSCFEVRVPVVRSANVSDSNSEGMDNQPVVHHRVVVVEDQKDNREALVDILTRQGHEVHAAADGAAGVEVILEHLPSVAIVDVGLPNVSGYELARKVRATDRGSNVTLVALTGYGQSHDIDAAKKAGFDHHLVKPLDLRMLERVLRATTAVASSEPAK